MVIWPVISLLLISLVWLHWRYKNRRFLEMAKTIPGPPAIPILGNALKFMCQPEELVQVIKDLMNEYGGVLKFWLGNELNIVVSNPEDIKLLLMSNKTSVKGPQYKYMADVIGGGLLSGSGPMWRKHRKLATPNYGKRAIESYNDIFNFESRSLVKTFQKLTNGEEINIYKYIVQATSWTVCQTLMGLTKEETMELPHLQTLIDQTHRAYDIVFDRMTKWYLQIDPIFWLTNSYKELKYYIQFINEFSEKILQHRMLKLSNMEERLDILNSQEDLSTNTQLSVIDRFILDSHELNSKELITETFTIFTTSQEPSAKVASFLLLMMAFHPTYQEKLYQEIKEIIGDEETTITDEHLKNMPYLEMIFKEVIRLFPAGGMMQRTINEDIIINSYTLPAGSSLLIPIYHIHRDPRFWKDPDVFDPERFSPENSKNHPTYSFIPFSLGPMDCLGRYYGAKLIKTIVVKVLQEFKLFSSKSYKDLRIAISISATSLDGHHAILIPRH